MSPKSCPCLCHQSVGWKQRNCLSSVANITPQVPAKPLHKAKLLLEIWAQLQKSPKRRKEDKLDSSGLWLPPLLQWNDSGCSYKAQITTPQLFTAQLCFAGRIGSDPMDKPVSCEGCFDLWLHLGGCRWPQESWGPCCRWVLGALARSGAAVWCWPFLSIVNQLQTPPLEQLMSLPGAAPQTWPCLLWTELKWEIKTLLLTAV